MGLRQFDIGKILNLKKIIGASDSTISEKSRTEGAIKSGKIRKKLVNAHMNCSSFQVLCPSQSIFEQVKSFTIIESN